MLTHICFRFTPDKHFASIFCTIFYDYKLGVLGCFHLKARKLLCPLLLQVFHLTKLLVLCPLHLKARKLRCTQKVCSFEWMPFQRKESECPVIRNFVFPSGVVVDDSSSFKVQEVWLTPILANHRNRTNTQPSKPVQISTI